MGVLLWALALYLVRKFEDIAIWPKFWVSIVFIAIAAPMLAVGLLAIFQHENTQALAFYDVVSNGTQKIHMAIIDMPSFVIISTCGLYGIGLVIALFRIAVPYIRLLKISKCEIDR